MSVWRSIYQEVLLKVCELCRSYPCNCHCPNYVSLKTAHHCSICKEGIYEGEEYIENDIGEYAHWECIDYGRDLAKWLGFDIRTMEER